MPYWKTFLHLLFIYYRLIWFKAQLLSPIFIISIVLVFADYFHDVKAWCWTVLSPLLNISHHLFKYINLHCPNVVNYTRARECSVSFIMSVSCFLAVLKQYLLLFHTSTQKSSSITSISLSSICVKIVFTHLFDINREIMQKMSSMVEDWISQANAKQRWGRAGRVKPGICFCLYTCHRYENLMRSFQVSQCLILILHVIVCGYYSDVPRLMIDGQVSTQQVDMQDAYNKNSIKALFPIL